MTDKSSTTPESQPTVDASTSVLIYAWRQFLNYDQDSISEKNRHHRVRGWIIGLGVVISIFAVIATVIKTPLAVTLIDYVSPLLRETSIGFLIVLCGFLVLLLLSVVDEGIFHGFYDGKNSRIRKIIALFVLIIIYIGIRVPRVDAEPLNSLTEPSQIASANLILLLGIACGIFAIIFAPFIVLMLGRAFSTNDKKPGTGSAATTPQSSGSSKPASSQSGIKNLWIKVLWVVVLAASVIAIVAIATQANLLRWEMHTNFAGHLGEVVRVMLIVLPVLTASLMAYAAQFMPVLEWVMQRVAAEDIRRNIYLYRMRAGIYADDPCKEKQGDQSTASSQKKNPAETIEPAASTPGLPPQPSQPLTETPPPSTTVTSTTTDDAATVSMKKDGTEIVEPAAPDAGLPAQPSQKPPETPPPSTTMPNMTEGDTSDVNDPNQSTTSPNNRLSYQEEEENVPDLTPEERLRRIVSNIIKRMIKAGVITNDLRIGQLKLDVEKAFIKYEIFDYIPKETDGKTPKDTGFNDFPVDRYIDCRVEDQRKWYVKKYNEDERNLRAWRVIVLFVTGLSSALAALGLEPYVVITTALVSAFTLWMGLQMHGQTYTRYYNTATLIDSRLARWNADKLDSKATKDPCLTVNFVRDIEQIMQDERDEWRKQAIVLQTSVEQSLLKETKSASESPSK